MYWLPDTRCGTQIRLNMNRNHWAQSWWPSMWAWYDAAAVDGRFQGLAMTGTEPPASCLTLCTCSCHPLVWGSPPSHAFTNRSSSDESTIGGGDGVLLTPETISLDRSFVGSAEDFGKMWDTLSPCASFRQEKKESSKGRACI